MSSVYRAYRAREGANMLDLTFGINITSMKLYNGRRSFYLRIDLGRSSVFLSRWDTERVLPKPKQIDLYRGPIMTWYVGAF